MLFDFCFLHRSEILAEKYFSMSPYNYVGNNPVMLIDPDGRSFIGAYGTVKNTGSAEVTIYSGEGYSDSYRDASGNPNLIVNIDGVQYNGQNSSSSGGSSGGLFNNQFRPKGFSNTPVGKDGRPPLIPVNFLAEDAQEHLAYNLAYAHFFKNHYEIFVGDLLNTESINKVSRNIAHAGLVREGKLSNIKFAFNDEPGDIISDVQYFSPGVMGSRRFRGIASPVVDSSWFKADSQGRKYGIRLVSRRGDTLSLFFNSYDDLMLMRNYIIEPWKE